MRRKGYTLSEVLVALGIVGVLAAIMLPLVNKARPNTNKILYLKSYDSLVQAVSTIANSENIYGETRSVGGKDYNLSKYPLLDYGQPKSNEFHAFQGATKLCELIRESFGVAANQVHAACGTDGGIDNYNFETKNGVHWKIEPKDNSDPLAGNPRGTIEFYNLVTIDVNGSKAPNTMSNDPSVASDRFQFYITSDGDVTPSDLLGQSYIANRANYNKKRSENFEGLVVRNRNNIEAIKVNVAALTGNIADGVADPDQS